MTHSSPLSSRPATIPRGAFLTAAPDVAHAALRESEDHHRANFVRAPVPMLVLDMEATVTDVSDRLLSLLGYSRHEVVGRAVSEFQTPSSARQTTTGWEDFLARGEARDLERRFRRRDGAELDVILSATVERTPGSGEARVIAALTDVTDRKRAEVALRASEEGLRHAQKMEAIGQLTGSIAHDFNNVLQAVTSNLELILGRVGNDGAEVARLADNALDAAKRATAITSQLLTFARGQQLDLKPHDPVGIVNGLRGLLARAAGDRITLHIDVPEQSVGTCLADLNQLECALLNLVINARDAIGGQAGTITVSLRSEEVVAVAGNRLPRGSYIRLAVRDDGPGMSEEVCRRAFEPFFTTKGPGKGTGLGLAQIHSFAHQCGGTASIASAPWKGTEVSVLLPRAHEATGHMAVPVTPRAEAEAEAEPGMGETVLIVEDDAMVRSTLAETLAELGYQTIEADDADAALALLEGGAMADLILTDISMPGSMDGLEFARVAHGRFPQIPVILTTGHIEVLGDMALPRDVGILSKPYTRGDISAAARHALVRRKQHLAGPFG
ncbi:PAS domain S-box protein [Belnapia sp. T6]|uniref:histidine kinase n=1 Tax=Belnapia mucosa TaxID=2804532 RepID=A0ABS1V0G8_9PROT|nr:ATP-binding protein [Belnapia mucosa]MBL6454566.1 PAS domain S-box protein [Belnapia mucosa]